MKKKILMIGPQPPAIGGIASIVFLLKKHLPGIDFIDSSKPTVRFFRLIQPFSLVVKMMFYCLMNFRCKVIYFSSANRSFWEKSFWAVICRICGAKAYIVMVDGNFPEFYSKLSVRKKSWARFFMRKAVVVAQSPSWKNFFKEIFPDSEIDVITGGVDTDFLSPVEKQQSDKLQVLYVGWIIKEKGIHDILEACSIVKSQRSDFQVDLVGPVYCDEVELRSLIEERSLQDLVKIIGPIHSRDSLKQKYTNADVFVFPSHYEGFPMALLEALSCGLPCIGSRVGGIPDILDDGRCGFLVEPKAPEELAKALIAVLADHELRTKLSNTSRVRAVQEFSISASVESYRKLLGLGMN